MSQVTFHEDPVTLAGQLPQNGETAPDFHLVAQDLSEKTLADYGDKFKILNIFPSVDTGTCAKAARQFNEKAAQLSNTVVLCISADLPFAQKRFCAAEGLNNVEMLSAFRSKDFADQYGVAITDSPLAGLCARAGIVLDGDNRVIYTQLVKEISDEPDYDSALKAIQA